MTEKEMLRAMLPGKNVVDYRDPEMTPTCAAFAREAGLTQIGATPPVMTICVPCDDEHPLLALDNEIGDCAGCGCRIQYRPSVAHAKDRKLCIRCAFLATGAYGEMLADRGA